jgi:hypothetical protein
MRPATETYPLIPLYTPLTKPGVAMKEAETLRKATSRMAMELIDHGYRAMAAKLRKPGSGEAKVY